MRAGFIGLGGMGAPMARRVASGGFLTHVWNRTPRVAEELAAELGIAAVATPAELAARVDVTLICVTADRDVTDVVEALLPGLKPGAVVVDHSTVSGATERSLAAKVEQAHAAYLDIPVSGGVEGARNGRLAMMAGGPADALTRIRPVLETMAARIEHFGPVGNGQGAKAVNQIMVAGIAEAVTEALGFGAALGLDMDKLIDTIASGAAGNWFLEKRGPTMVRGTFQPGFKLAHHHKDLKICEAMAAELGLTLPLALATAADYQRLMDGGFGDEDISSLYRLKAPKECSD